MQSLDLVRRNLLERLFSAFNRHDGASVMACMTDDVVFFAAGGPNICGRKISGTDDVRKAFENVWTEMPDVAWDCTRHEVFGDHGLSEWIFRATTKSGERFEVEGCDLFTFRDERICQKSAFRKERPLQPAVQG